MRSISLHTPTEITAQIAARAKRLRLSRDLTQAGLSARSGVPLGTLKHFERTGQIALLSLVKLAVALNADRELGLLFDSGAPATLDDVLRDAMPDRKRGRRS